MMWTSLRRMEINNLSCREPYNNTLINQVIVCNKKSKKKMMLDTSLIQAPTSYEQQLSESHNEVDEILPEDNQIQQQE